MRITNKQKVFDTILNCASEYNKFLANKNFMFVLGKPCQYFSVEVFFKPSNFLHLMGVDLIKEMSAIDFYDACMNHKLSINDFSLKKDGTSILKSDVSRMLMEIHKLSRMYGAFLQPINSKNPVEVVIGNDKGCIGFIQSEKGYLAPVTLLKGSTKEHSKRGTVFQVVAVYKKYMDEPMYKVITYLAKNSEKHQFKDCVSELNWPDAIDDKIDKVHLKS